MTKKHYVAIAGALKDERAALFATHPEDLDRTARVLDATILTLCKVLASDNAKFNASRFLEACGHGTVVAS